MWGAVPHLARIMKNPQSYYKPFTDTHTRNDMYKTQGLDTALGRCRHLDNTAPSSKRNGDAKKNNLQKLFVSVLGKSSPC